MSLPAPERFVNLLGLEHEKDLRHRLARDGVVAFASLSYYRDLIDIALRIMADELPGRWRVDTLIDQAIRALQVRMAHEGADYLVAMHLLRVVTTAGDNDLYALTEQGLDWLLKHKPTEAEEDALEGGSDALARPED